MQYMLAQRVLTRVKTEIDNNLLVSRKNLMVKELITECEVSTKVLFLVLHSTKHFDEHLLQLLAFILVVNLLRFYVLGNFSFCFCKETEAFYSLIVLIDTKNVMINKEVGNGLYAILQLQLILINVIHHEDSNIVECCRKYFAVFSQEVADHEQHTDNTIAKSCIGVILHHITGILYRSCS